MLNFFRNRVTPSLFRFATQKQVNEQQLNDTIARSIEASKITVEDISAGTSCGLMYNITVQSKSFAGKSLVQQHQMVTGALKDQLKTIHGFNLVTRIPKDKEGHQHTDTHEKGERVTKKAVNDDDKRKPGTGLGGHKGVVD